MDPRKSTCAMSSKRIAAALMVCYLLAFEPQRALVIAATNFLNINYQQSLPPLSIQTRTNGLRLRFTGNPGQSFLIQRAAAIKGPWVTIAKRSTPAASTLLLFDITDP